MPSPITKIKLFRVTAMFSRWVRTWDSNLLTPLLLRLAGLGVTPNALTACSLIVFILAGLFLFEDQRILGGTSILLGGLLDGLDGELARVTGRQTNLGAFLDSIFDHIGDFAVALGLACFYLGRGSRVEVVLLLAATFGSLYGSQVRSRAGMLGVDLKDIGIWTRFERNLVLIIGIFINAIPLALWILAVLNNVSAAQRIIHTVRAMSNRQETEAATSPVAKEKT